MPKTIIHNSHTSIPDRVLNSAFTLFHDWENNHAGFELPAEIENRQMVHHLLDQVFRRLGFIDWTIDRVCSSRPGSRELKTLLRLAVAQLFYQNRVPAPLVVDSCVRFAGSRFSRREAGFVNAVLRRLLREREAKSPKSQPRLSAVARLNLGRELIEQWKRHLSEVELESLAELAQSPAPVLVRQLRGGSEAVVEAGDSLRPLPGFDWTRGFAFFECLKPREFFASRLFRNRFFYVQDPATVLPVFLMQVRTGERIADLCAAPGGKSLMLLGQLTGGGHLISADRDCRRLRRLVDNLAGQGRLSILLADATAPPLLRQSMDGVLLDVPCSNTGVVRRRPDVRWRFTRAKLERLRHLQAAMLFAAAPLVVPGGRLVYSTCSIEPEENCLQVRHFLRRVTGFSLVDECQLYPGPGHDGAYAALLVKDRLPSSSSIPVNRRG